jgi:type III secretory pathway component EscR
VEDFFDEDVERKRNAMKTLSPEVLLIVSLGVGLVPIVIAIGTCYLKFSIVLSLLRSGFGTQQAPSTSLVMALSMVMSLVVMQPVIHETHKALGDLSVSALGSAKVGEFMKRGEEITVPWRTFLLKHSGEREVEVFRRLSVPSGSTAEVGTPPAEPSLVTLLGAFVLSEIKKGFLIAFLLLIPFFVIDLVVGNILVALGLTMMSPSTVSLPLKLLLFVSSDGWLLIAKSLIAAYR